MSKFNKIKEFVIIDINRELVLAYKTIQKDVIPLIDFLSELQIKYFSLDEQERKDYYYHIRNHFNARREHLNFDSYNEEWIERTAQLIFLNRTCFNGLFRVNSKGDFNVPMGKYKNPIICNSDNLKSVCKLLQKTEVYWGDFSHCEQWVDSRTFVYFDPPYRPISQTANFTSYSQYNFNDCEQLRLRDFFNLLNSKGAKLMLSNSDPKNEDINDDFFDNAYTNYTIERVKANRNINSDAKKRGQINEILVLNY